MVAMAVAVLQLRRQVGGVDDGAGGESTGTFQAILELADVARPVISHHHAHGVFADGALEAGGAIDAIEKMFDQHRNVSFALAQRWDANVDDVETEEEVFAEAALVNRSLQVAVGGGEHTNVDGNGAGGADRANLFFLKGTEELGLE